jgi:hypothetical protein
MLEVAYAEVTKWIDPTRAERMRNNPLRHSYPSNSTIIVCYRLYTAQTEMDATQRDGIVSETARNETPSSLHELQ